MTSIRLASGSSIPQLGLGVWQSPQGAPTRDAVTAALRAGYRHVDTARVYRNEIDVGAAVRDSDVSRDQIFVTTKLWNDDQGYDSTLRAFDKSLERLGLDYIDLYLLHWPVAGKRLDSWRALERLHAEGRARSIGVSNFLVPHLEELLAIAKTPPHANQIELSPFLQRRPTVELCRKMNIVIEAYSPLTRGEKLGHHMIVEIARESGRTAAQILLRWSVQNGHVVLPKSVRAERILENAAIFDFSLTAEQMARLDALEENLVTGWDPAEQR